MVDARDISRTDMTTQQYTAALIQRGTEKLAECGIVECLEAATLPFVNFSYKKDYDLGDIVTVRKKAWGIEMDKGSRKYRRSTKTAAFPLSRRSGILCRIV